jgi:plasmid stabilization system protein ParE
MKVIISKTAFRDVEDGINFYEEQEQGAGHYFYTCVLADVDRLATLGGLHAKPFGKHHRMICSRHPFAIFYEVENDTVIIKAVLDCRRRPHWITTRLKKL